MHSRNLLCLVTWGRNSHLVWSPGFGLSVAVTQDRGAHSYNLSLSLHQRRSRLRGRWGGSIFTQHQHTEGAQLSASRLSHHAALESPELADKRLLTPSKLSVPHPTGLLLPSAPVILQACETFNSIHPSEFFRHFLQPHPSSLPSLDMS